MTLIIKNKKDLTDPEIREIAELLMATWPSDNENATLEKVISFYKNGNSCSFNKVLLYYEKEVLIGHTEVFNREIIIESEKKEILALAAVCVNKQYRGKKLGAELVKKAFEFVENNQFECSIFQTNVPGFYEKLNCKQIANSFINSKSDTDINKNPWRDPYVMVYPKSYNLGDNTIDLNGLCY